MNLKLSALAALLALAASGPALAEDRRMFVHNESPQAIYFVRVSNIDDPMVGPDVLRDRVIMGNEAEIIEPINPQGYCRFDVEVAYETGQEVNLWDVNFCELGHIYVSDSGRARVTN